MRTAWLLVTILLPLVSSKIATRYSDDARSHFQEFIKTNQRDYSSSEEISERYRIFQDNLKIIDELNAKDTKAQYTINQFADMSAQEFRGSYLMPQLDANHFSTAPQLPSSYNGQPIPSKFDWRGRGAVTPVKNQAACGSCWAFSATEAIESAWFLAGNQLTELSPQQMVDCSWSEGDHGCRGGYPDDAYQYVMDAGGLESETAYPYMGWDQPWTCTFNKSGIVAKISGYSTITKNQNETEMLYTLYEKAPLSVCVDASMWQFYEYGVMGEYCGTSIDHCVQLVGYEANREPGINAWIVRNSWGSGWGYDGYIYVQEGDNYCAIAEMVTLPIIAV